MTVTGTLDEAFGRIVARLPWGALVVTYRGEPLTHFGMRRLGLAIGDNAFFACQQGDKTAALFVDEEYECETGFG